jgi:protein-S-isoprenylcysteine O-methyltransferase Ste14
MIGMVLLAAVAVASTVTKRDVVDVILTVMDGVPPRGIGPFARISVVALSFLGCNAMLVSGLGMRLPAVTCWPLLCSWINTSNILFLTLSAALLSRRGSLGGRRSWVGLNALPLRL